MGFTISFEILSYPVFPTISTLTKTDDTILSDSYSTPLIACLSMMLWASLCSFPRLAAAAEADLPVSVEANHLDVHDKRVHAEGEAHIEYDTWKATSESIDYNFTNNQLVAPSSISVENAPLYIQGDCADLHLKEQTGDIDHPSLRLQATPKQPARFFSAEHLRLENGKQALLSHARYTGCSGSHPDWWIQSDSIRLDQDKGIGEARDTTLFFKGVPLFYTPWLDFSLTGERKSGLLPPTIGSSTERGLEFQLPLYYTFAPNYDTTLTPRWMSKRGLQLNSQFRYLTPSHQGELNGEYLANDQVTGTERHLLSWKNTSTFTDPIGTSRFRLNLNSVSDGNYFADLSEHISATSQGVLPREMDWAKYLHAPLDTTALLRLRVQRFQLLQTLPSNAPYERTPQLNLSTNTPLTQLSPNLSLYTQMEGARFTQATQSSVSRAIFYPQLRYTSHTPATLFEGHLGLNGRLYKEDGTTTPIWTPITSLDEHVYFDPNQHDEYHPTLEARAYYVYIPYRDQSSIRSIDSAPYASDDLGLFTENDFTGSDRINDANRVTLALNAHWKHHSRDTERLMLGLAQRFSFETPRISPGNLQSRNPLFVYGRGEMGPGFDWTAGLSYDLDKHITQHIQAGFQYRPNNNALLNVIYRFQRDAPLTPQPNENWRQIDIAGQWALSSQWKSVWRWNYDIENRKTLEALGGLEYTKGCWGIRTVAQQSVTSASTSSHGFFIQLELQSLGNVGANPIDVLRRSIPGYIEPSTIGGETMQPSSPSLFSRSPKD
jgi:LPS-assembly protein